MISKTDYDAYHQSGVEFLHSFANKLRHQSPKLHEDLGPIMAWFSQPGNITTDSPALLRFAIGPYRFHMQVYIPLMPRQFQAIIKTHELITHPTRLPPGLSETWYHIPALDFHLTKDNWDIAGKTPSTVGLYDFIPRLERYIEEIEGELY